MRQATMRLLALLAACLLTVGSAGARDEEPSDRERREAARAEQRQAREEAEREAREAAEATEREAERLRLEALGAGGGALLEEERGFFVAIDGFFADTSGAERTVARVGDVVTTATTAEQLDTDGNGLPDAFTLQNERALRLEYDGELSPRLEVGWRRGTGAMISVRYWGHSADARASATSTLSVPAMGGGPGFILGGIDNQGFENLPGSGDSNPGGFVRPFGTPILPSGSGLHGADSVSASGSLEASRLDLLYTHVGLARPRLEMQYRVGLSVLQVERQESTVLHWRSFPRASVAAEALSLETIETKTDAQAYGLMAAIGGRYHLTDSRKWSLRFGLELSGLANDEELSFRNSWVASQTGAEPLTVVAQDTTDSSAKSLMTTVDADLALEARLGSRLRLGLGYRHASWLEAFTEERFPRVGNQSLLVSESVDLDFSGPYVRMAWFF